MAAARRYPHVWWQLWTCPECVEAVVNINRLLDAEAQGQIPPPPMLRPGDAAAGPAAEAPAPPPLPALHTPLTLRLERGFLRLIFSPQLSYGTAWGEDGNAVFLGDHDLPGCRFSIQVSQMSANHCDLEISIEPPVEGTLVVSFGETHFRTALVAEGSTVLKAIPITLLVSRSGPDMVISVERE